MKLKLFLTSAATAALLASAGLAQTATDPVPDAGVAVDPNAAIIEPRFTSKADMTVGDVVGMFTYDAEGNRIGEIDYVVMQPGGLAAVIGIGGFLGLGEYTVALPFKEFELRPDGPGFVLDTTKDALKEIPEFDESGAESLPAETPIATVMDAGESTNGAAGSGTEAPGDAGAEVGGDAAIALSATQGHAQEDTGMTMATMDGGMGEMMGVIDQMMQAMPAESSGKVDGDFLLMMIPHHQSAIDMAQLELTNGADEATKAMAQEFIDAQKAEITQMRAMLEAMGVAPPAAPTE